MIELSNLILLTLLALLWYHWSRAQLMKQQALHYVLRQCEQQGLQLLDQTVAMRAIWLKRDQDGRMRLWRRYHFEFTSTGDDRYTGRAVFLGKRALNVDFGVYRLN